MNRVVVIGSSISGSLAACFLKLRHPDLEVVAIQRPRVTFPIVGESLTEFSTQMLHELGLASYLEEQHFHKYGLTFYFKQNLDDPSDFTYATHEANRIPPMPSNQVNRFTLAKRLLQRAAELGVQAIDGSARDVSLRDGGPHRIVYSREDGATASIDARWIVDTSGRRRFLADKLGLKRAPRFQRSSFWFRLEDFDKDILRQMVEVKERQHCFDSYYVTHHFFGRHNWIWAIPMRSERADCRALISIGIVYRPDLYDGEVTSVESFVARVGAEHPVVARLVQSGRIVDTNTYRNYFYETAQSYSRQGWFIVGDAGFTVDPLYSTGLAMTSIQVRQVEALIEADRRGELSEAYVRDLEALYTTTRNSLQYEIGTLFEVMGDPFQAHLRMHCASAFYFYVLLPSWLNGYVTDAVGARIIVRLLEDGAQRFVSLRALLAVASQRLGALPATQITNWYGRTINWELRGPGEEMMPEYLARCSVFFARIRWHALRCAGWRGWPRHVWLCAADLLKAAVCVTVLRRRRLRDVKLARWLVRPRGASERYRLAGGLPSARAEAVEPRSIGNLPGQPRPTGLGRAGTGPIPNPGGSIP